jgi:outer membrane murein-binding lipoprotein Lpp
MKHGCWIVLSVVLLAGCTLSQEELADVKETAKILNEEVANIKTDLMLIEDPVERAKMEARLNEIEPYVTQVNDVIQGAESGSDAAWGVLETAMTVAAGFFPGLGFMIPLVRSARRTTKAIVESVDQGGGPVNPDAARKALEANPKARATYLKIKNGK